MTASEGKSAKRIRSEAEGRTVESSTSALARKQEDEVILKWSPVVAFHHRDTFRLRRISANTEAHQLRRPAEEGKGRLTRQGGRRGTSSPGSASR